MGEQHYLNIHSLPQPEGVSKPSAFSDVIHSPDARGSSAYPDLTYSTSASFNYPASCDASLLTPTSSADSPPEQQHHARKPGSHFSGHPGSPPQENTPPGSSSPNMYPTWNHFSTSSPMPASTTIAPDFAASYGPDGRRTPAPPEPYLGSYGVSNGPASSAVEDPPYYMQVAPMDHPLLRDPATLAAHGSHSHHHLSSAGMLHESRRPILETSMMYQDAPMRPAVHTGHKTRATRVARKKPPPRRSSDASKRSSQPVDPLREQKNCFGVVQPPTLRSSCPDIDRLVFELRWKQRSLLGNHMWEKIREEMQEQTGKVFGREDLQMKFRRARQHIEWFSEDEDILLRAWVAVERDRYKNVLALFRELGGSRNMCLNPVDIEAKVVAMKLEERVYTEGPKGVNLRRRAKVNTRRRVGENQPDEEVEALMAERNNPAYRHEGHMVPQIKQEILDYHHGGGQFEDEYEV